MATELAVLAELSAAYPPSVAFGHVVLLAPYVASGYAFTSGDISGNEISIATNFVVGTRVTLTGLSDFDLNTVYFVSNASPLRFSATIGGSDVTITAPADGTVTDVAPFISGDTESTCEIQNMADLARYEVSDYLGIVTRPVYTPPVGEIATNQAGERAAVLTFANSSVTLTNTAGAPDNPSNLPVTFSGFTLIQDGSPTPGDTTGFPMFTNSFASNATVDAGGELLLNIEISFPIHDATQSP